MLEKYNGRYYKIHNSDKEETLLINSRKDKHLIGQTIYLRSPITCKCGDDVCHKCFGTTSLLSLDIPDGVSAYESEEVTKVVNQMILSTKHLLTTVSEKITFNEDFYKFFTMTAGEVNPIINNTVVDNLDDWAVWIDPNELCKSDELDNDSSFNTYIAGRFYVQNLVTKEYKEICTTEEREMFLTEECLELMKKGKGFIKFKDMEEDTTLFEIVIMNNELTKPLYELIDLLNKANRDVEMGYADMAARFTQLLLDAKIDAMALAGELIINRLLRNDPDDDFNRPDFSQKEIPPYQIYTVLKALENNKSAFIGLASQDIKRQLLSDDIVTKKTGSSYLDPFFKKETSTKRLQDIRKIIQKKKAEGISYI